MTNTSLMFLIASFSGIGIGMCNMTCLLIPQHYFLEKRALAGGIAVTGMSVAVLAFVPLAEVLLELFGWRGTIMMMSAFVFQLIPCVALYRPHTMISDESGRMDDTAETREKPQQKDAGTKMDTFKQEGDEPIFTISDHYGRESYDVSTLRCDVSKISADTKHTFTLSKNYTATIKWFKQMIDLSLLKDPWLCMFVFGGCLVNIGLFTAYTHSVSRAVDIGLTSQQAAFIGSCIGIGGLVSRLIMMFPLSTGKMNLIWAYSCGQMAGGFVLCAHYFVTGLAGSTTLSILYGVTEGQYVTIVRFILNSSTRIIEFRGFLSQFSTNPS